MAYESTMEIKEHPDGFEVLGPFDSSDAPLLKAAIRDGTGSNVRCIEPSFENAQALVELLSTEIQPWLEEEDRRLRLIVQGTADMFAQLNREGSRIQFVGIARTPEPG